MIELLIPLLQLTDLGTEGLVAIISGAIGTLIGHFGKRNKNSTDIEIARINSNSRKFEKDIELLRKELKEMTQAYNDIKLKYIKAKEDDHVSKRLIKDYENLLRHYRFIFKLAYEMIKPKLEGDSEALVLLEEVKSMFADDFKL